MVYQLQRPLEQARLREGALHMPFLEMDVLQPVAEPYLVWSPDLPEGLLLHNEARRLTWTFHNAGGAACNLESITTGAPWLLAEVPTRALAPGGRPAELSLRLLPAAGLAPGEHRTEVVLRFVWPGGTQELRRPFVLRVPEGPIPWFHEERLCFRGTYRERWVAFQAKDQVQVYYGDERVAECKPGRRLSLFPAEYRLEGKEGSATFRLPGPRLRTTLRNLGSETLNARLISPSPWLQARPEAVELQPGEAISLVVQVDDDGRHWHETAEPILLREPSTGEVLGRLPVERHFTLPGAVPQAMQLPVVLPPVTSGGLSSAHLTIANRGEQPLQVESDRTDRPVVVAPGSTAEVPVAVGPPDTNTVRHLEGHLRLRTNGPLPYWRFYRVPYSLDVVAVTLITRELDFGTVRYRNQRMKVIQIRRTDHRRGRYVIDFPPEYQGVFRLSGDLLFMRNMQPRPAMVDDHFEVRDEALGGVVIGSLHVKGHCLVPKLGVTMPEVRLVPGQTTTAPIQIHDLGGGLELHSVESDQPWAVPSRRGERVTVAISSSFWDRGERSAVITFTSNDFVDPVQQHELRVHFRPTLRMRLLDFALLIIGPVWRLIQPLIRSFRSRR